MVRHRARGVGSVVRSLRRAAAPLVLALLGAFSACGVLAADPQPIIAGAATVELDASSAVRQVAELASAAMPVTSAAIRALEAATVLEATVTSAVAAIKPERIQATETSLRADVAIVVCAIVCGLVLWGILEIARIRRAVSG